MKKLIRLSAMTLFTCVAAMLFFGINGSAYIDPSVMTYLIQAIAGIVIAVGAGLGIYFRRAKRKINEKLNIEENRNKEVESDEIVVTDEDSQA
jgi:hypothetical protein